MCVKYILWSIIPTQQVAGCCWYYDVCCSLPDAAADLSAAPGCRPAGWLSEFAELGEKARALSNSFTGAATAPSGSASPGSSHHQTATAASPSSSGNAAAAGAEGSKLTFSFEMTIQGLDAAHLFRPGVTGISHNGLSHGQLTGPKDALTYSLLLSRVLGDHPGSPYLIPAGEEHTLGGQPDCCLHCSGRIYMLLPTCAISALALCKAAPVIHSLLCGLGCSGFLLMRWRFPDKLLL